MMTELVFREDAYAQSCEATITAVEDNAILLDRTVFYPMGGGQPGDTGVLRLASGDVITISDTRKHESTGVAHLIDPASPPAVTLVGQTVSAELNWARRYSHMRIHTLLHLLSVVIPAGVTGGSIRDGSGRLDFEQPESNVDKERVAAELKRQVTEYQEVSILFITDAELDAQPELVKTMAVKPPTGTGTVRLVNISNIDLQPCGGTHVAHTAEIGQVVVKKIEKKGKHNRRVNVAFAPQ
ncbi:MAG: alanyl-tRNA editing protein [Pseudomonadota bacterium]